MTKSEAALDEGDILPSLLISLHLMTMSVPCDVTSRVPVSLHTLQTVIRNFAPLPSQLRLTTQKKTGCLARHGVGRHGITA